MSRHYQDQWHGLDRRGWHMTCFVVGAPYVMITAPLWYETPGRVGVQGTEERSVKIFRDYALGWVLLGLFVLFWIGQTLAGWQEFLAEQSEHGQVAEVFGESGYVWNWARTTLENWQSEMLQVFAMVVLTSFLIFKGSPESRDGDDEMKQTLARLERRLEELAASGAIGNDNTAQTRRIWSVTERAMGD
jgi:hypothetical protein